MVPWLSMLEVTTKSYPAMLNVPALIFKVSAEMSPAAVPPKSKVKVSYEASGIVLEAVKVKLPAAALGIVTRPVDTVTNPELLRVVLTVKALLPMAKVPLVKVNTLAVVEPVAVPPKSKVKVLYTFAGKLDAVEVKWILPT